MAGAYRMDFDAKKCRDCKKCTTQCPMWAIGGDHKIEKPLCIGCRECSKACVGKAYSYGRDNGDKK
jgi:Fe-S-cluster-containing hydrogenase component 2